MRFFPFLLCAGICCGQPLRLQKTIPLSVEGRIDHLSIDPKMKRLYLSALGNNTVEAVDVAAGRVVHSFSGMSEPQGVAYVPGVNRIFIANGKDGKVRVYDGTGFKAIAEIEVGEDADNVRYDAANKLVWIGHGDGALAAIEPATGKRVRDIYLDAHPESFQLEKGGNRIFANVPDAHEIEVIDRQQGKILAKWPVKAAGANFPMALDEPNRRVIVGCRKPARLLTLDMETGKVVGQVECPGDTDDLFLDAARKRVYVAGGAGYIEIFEQKSADEYRSIAKVQTAEGARTALFAPALNAFYLAVPHRGKQASEVRVFNIE